MIDWLTLRCISDLHIDAGSVVSLRPDGSIEWQTPKRQELEGSHSSKVMLRRSPVDGNLEISGNPVKFMQGHNVFGADDLPSVVRGFVLAVHDRMGHQLTEHQLTALDAGLVFITRIDVNEAWHFGTKPRALSAVNALSQYATLTHRGRGSLVAEGTAMWGKGSRRWSAKAYAKGHELTAKGHALPLTLPMSDELKEHAQGLVRFEFTIRSLELKTRGLDLVANWAKQGATPATLFSELFAKLNISDAAMTDSHALEDLPPRLQLVYDAWMAGKDLRTVLPRATFYRHRFALMSFGVDIATVRQVERSNVVPLRVVLTGKPAEIPAWAKGTPLLWEPRAA